MRRLVITDTAESDVQAIGRYIADQSDVATAEAVTDKILLRCERLADLPGTLGTDRSILEPDLRSTPQKGYVIFFRYAGDAVEIVSILDARRDVTAHFDSGEGDD